MHRSAAVNFAKDQLPMTFPLVCGLAAEGIPVRLTCGVLGFSPPGVLQVARSTVLGPLPRRQRHRRRACRRSEFGYRLKADELEAAGHPGVERRVWRLCHQQTGSAARANRIGTARSSADRLAIFADRRCTGRLPRLRLES